LQTMKGLITSKKDLRKIVSDTIEDFDSAHIGQLDEIDFKKILRTFFVNLNFPGIEGDWEKEQAYIIFDLCNNLESTMKISTSDASDVITESFLNFAGIKTDDLLV